MDLSHRVSSRLVLSICEILPVSHCSVGGKVLKTSIQYPTASTLVHEVVLKFSAIVRQDVPQAHVYRWIHIDEG